MRAATIRLAAIALRTLIVVVVPLSAAAQDWSRMFRAPEVQNYELTMDHVRKYADVVRAMARDPEAASQLDRDFKGLQAKKPMPTLADVTALVDQNSAARSAIGKSGLTTRDYLLSSWAVANAGIHMMIRGKGAETSAQKANVALLESNRAEWTKIQQELARLAEQSVSGASRQR
jgi:hypothetical protein